MAIVLSLPGLDAARHLALEEHLLTTSGKAYILLWRSAPCVVVGRNQNIWQEVNAHWVRTEGGAVYRRLSGGGAVYHHPGNVNYSVLRPASRAGAENASSCCAPIEGFLSGCGVTAQRTPGGLWLNGRKFSGHAQFCARGRLLHHGTLLFDADLEQLARALAVDASGYESGAPRSKRATVMNLQPLLSGRFKSTADFIEALYAHLLKMEGNQAGALTDEVWRAVDARARDKYRTWSWNIGRGAKYRMQSNRHGHALDFSVNGGHIVDGRLDGRRIAALTGVRHDVAGMLPFRQILMRHIGQTLDEAAFIDWVFGQPDATP